jgi:hypothetical protein
MGKVFMCLSLPSKMQNAFMHITEKDNSRYIIKGKFISQVLAFVNTQNLVKKIIISVTLFG